MFLRKDQLSKIQGVKKNFESGRYNESGLEIKALKFLAFATVFLTSKYIALE